MAVDTAEDFYAVLEKSSLLTEEQFADAWLAAEQGKGPKAIAKALVQKDLLTRWQAGQLLAGRSSFFLGKYKLIEPIGRGGMGSVFLGQHTTMNRPVALKILSRQVGKDPASLERFLDEARAVAALDHPNIVQAYSVDHDADRYYLVMEYIDGRDLKRLVETEGLPDYETAADYIRQAADGLAHGHGRNMIHCDVKPSNLLVNHQGVVKIVDMGLARLNGREQEEVNGQGERILGSVDYLAPEQALESSDFDHRADIYSLGCTLYFLLTGHPPFPEGTLSERIVKHQMRQPRRIRRERRDAPAGLVNICEKMMAKRPEDRFQSAEEVSRVLAEWQLAEPKPKRIVPLKTAQPLEEPAGGRLRAINLEAEPQPTAAAGAGKDAPRKLSGFLQSRRRRIAALVVAGLAAATVAAATAVWLLGPALAPPDHDQTQAGPKTAGAEKNAPADRRSTPSDKPEDNHHLPPPDKPPAKKPPADQPGPDAPQKDPPEPNKPQPDKPEPDKPEMKDPEKGPQEPGKEPDKPEKKDPFRQLATAVDLPVLRANPGPDAQPVVPVALGMLHLELDATCEVELKGGNDVVPGRRHFALDRDGDAHSWLIRLDSDGEQGSDVQQTELARLSFEEQMLKFQWLHGAGRARGNYLRNCGLLVRVDQQTRWLALCQPKTVDPPVLDLDGGVTRTPLPLAGWMPKVGKLRLQVTGLEGPFPEHAFKPPGGISEKGLVEVLLSGDKLPGVALHVRLASRGRAASVELTGFYQLADRVRQPFKSGEAMRLTRKFYTMQKLAENARDKLKREDPRWPDVNRRVELLQEALEQLQALGELYHQIHQRGKIHFRVFRAVGDRQIELFTTKKTTPEDPDQSGKSPRESRPQAE